MKPAIPRWRVMAEADLGFVDRLGNSIYPDHVESFAAFAAKFRAGPDSCLVAEMGGKGVGYCLALPAETGAPPRLNQVRYAPARADAMHIHDIALAESARGHGLVPQALDHAAKVARGAGLETLSLIAVLGTERMWPRYGFAPAECERAILASFGGGVYMTRRL
jgi:GNAT superfamily N-acetyltransferase